MFCNTFLGSKLQAFDSSHLFESSLLCNVITCSFQVKFSSIIIPKTLALFEFVITLFLICILKGVLSDQNLTNTVLFTFSDNWLALYQSVNRVISCSNMYFKNCRLLWLLNKVVSLANNIIWLYVGKR